MYHVTTKTDRVVAKCHTLGDARRIKRERQGSQYSMWLNVVAVPDSLLSKTVKELWPIIVLAIFAYLSLC